VRKVIAASVVAGLAFGGWWVYASYVMRDRATQLAETVRSEILVVTRDVRGLPDQSDVREAIEARARELGAEVHDLRVSHEEVGGGREPEAVGSNQLQMVLERLQQNRGKMNVGMSPTRMHAMSIRPQESIVAQKYAVHGEIVVSYGIWSYREPLDVEKVLQRRLVR